MDIRICLRLRRFRITFSLTYFLLYCRPGSKSLNQVVNIRSIGEPVTKSSAAIQASGEAVFVDDIPSPINCLHGTYIHSSKPLARITSIKLRQEFELDGVRGILSSKDIPNGGENLGARSIFGSEPLFAEDIARCVGERLAFVVADTQKLADMAANSSVVDYSVENLEPPILCVEDAVERSSFFEVPPFLCPKNQISDVLKGMAEADHKIVSAELEQQIVAAGGSIPMMEWN